MKKSKIFEYLTKIDPSINYSKIGKKNSCLILELILREKNTNTKKYFYNCEEFLESS